MSHRRRGQWEDRTGSRGTPAERVLVQCGGHRILEAALGTPPPEAVRWPGAVRVAIKGRGLPRAAAGWPRDWDKPLDANCPNHGHHKVDVRRIVTQLDLADDGRAHRTPRRVDIQSVEWLG